MFTPWLWAVLATWLWSTEDSRSRVVSGLHPGSKWPVPHPLAFDEVQEMLTPNDGTLAC